MVVHEVYPHLLGGSQVSASIAVISKNKLKKGLKFGKPLISPTLLVISKKKGSGYFASGGKTVFFLCLG